MCSALFVIEMVTVAVAASVVASTAVSSGRKSGGVVTMARGFVLAAEPVVAATVVVDSRTEYN